MRAITPRQPMGILMSASILLRSVLLLLCLGVLAHQADTGLVSQALAQDDGDDDDDDDDDGGDDDGGGGGGGTGGGGGGTGGGGGGGTGGAAPRADDDDGRAPGPRHAARRWRRPR